MRLESYARWESLTRHFCQVNLTDAFSTGDEEAIPCPRSEKFLIVDDDARGRFYISRTLLRHHPEAVMQERQDLNTALALVRGLPQSEHRTAGEPSDAHWARSVGATRLLDKNAWLMIGQEVEDLI